MRLCPICGGIQFIVDVTEDGCDIWGCEDQEGCGWREDYEDRRDNE